MRRGRLRRRRPGRADPRRLRLREGVPRRALLPGGAADAHRAGQPGDGPQLPGRARPRPAAVVLMAGEPAQRVAVVTGAGAGIGAAVARRFAADGIAVAVVDRDLDAASRIVEELEAGGASATAIAADVADPVDVARIFETTDAWKDSLEILVNLAGISRPAMFENLDLETWTKVVDVSLTGTFRCREAARRLPEDGRGRIINVTSAAGIQGTIGQANYGAAKAAVIGLTKSLAKELGQEADHRQRGGPTGSNGDDGQRHGQREARRDARRVSAASSASPTTSPARRVSPPTTALVTGQVLYVDGGR